MPKSISTDMGGTSFDIAYVCDGKPGYALEPDIEGFKCNLPMLSIKALGTGGGSIAVVNGSGVRVGPQSAGALPGPAAFNLGFPGFGSWVVTFATGSSETATPSCVSITS